MREFNYYAPGSLREALGILARANGEARVLAGGTDLIDQMRTGRRTPAVVVDVKKIPELNRLEYVEKEGLHIGAAVPCTLINDHPVIRERYPILVNGTSLVGDVKVQNRASIGGNLCNAAPSADTAPPLICLGARAVISGPGGRREVLVEDFFRGPGQTVLELGELLVEVVVPLPIPNSAGSYQRLIPRAEMDIAIVGVGSFLAVERGSRRCREARIALGAVAPTPVRAREAESYLVGRELNQEAIQEAGERAVRSARPISDQRGSAEYRLEMVKVLTRRTLQECVRALGLQLPMRRSS